MNFNFLGGGTGIISSIIRLIEWGLIITLIYVGTLTYINFRNGITDLNAIPHLELWKQLPSKVLDFTIILGNNLM